MSAIDKEQVKKLAALARIELTEDEINQLEGDLSKILDYVDALKQVPTDGLPEIAQVTGLKNVLRLDEVTEDAHDARERIMKAAPETKNGLVKVKSVFK